MMSESPIITPFVDSSDTGMSDVKDRLLVRRMIVFALISELTIQRIVPKLWLNGTDLIIGKPVRAVNRALERCIGVRCADGRHAFQRHTAARRAVCVRQKMVDGVRGD